MRTEPLLKRVAAFFDGQNLYHAAKAAFGHPFPNYDPWLLAQRIAGTRSDWQLNDVYFYTGVPSEADNPRWHHFWTAKLAVLGTRRVHTFSRPLRYRNQVVALPAGGSMSVLVGQEKGIDIRIALDLVSHALDASYDVAIIFSQDQDLTEAVDDIKQIALRGDRWLKLASAFPYSPTTRNARGINGTDWLKIDRATYDACLDPNDYRPKPAP